MDHKKDRWHPFVHIFLKDKKISMIVLSVILLGLCVVFFNKTNGIESRLQQRIDALGNGAFILGLYREEVLVNENAHVIQDLEIKGWMDDVNNTYYLFLPAFSKAESGDGWRFYFNQYEQIQINETNIVPGDVFSLEEGVHHLSAGDGTKLRLEVLNSKNIRALLLETDQQNLEELRLAKENMASGNYFLLDEKGSVEGSGKVEVLKARGNLSFTQTDKKSFAFHLKEKTAIAGMDQSRKWILTANAFDPSLSRNYVAEQMARSLCMLYVPESIYVDLYIDGEYQGNYLLQEKVEIADGRLEIRDLEKETERINMEEDLSSMGRTIEDLDGGAQLRYVDLEFEPEDIASGYLLELDMEHRYDDEASGFLSKGGQPVVVKSPQYSGKNQVAYVADLYQRLEDALQTEDGIHEQDGLHYYDYLDMDSFAQKYLIDEMTKNTDASLSSFFMYIPQENPVLYAGPIWDYDKSLGAQEVRDIYSLAEPEGFYASEDLRLEVTANREHSLYYLLCQQESFQKAYKEMYVTTLRDAALKIAEEEIEKNYRRIEKSAIMDAIRWKKYGNVSVDEIKKQFYDGNIGIQTFLKQRICFLDEKWK